MNVRNLFLFLLLANLLFFWWAGIYSEQQKTDLPLAKFDDSIPTLELITERNTRQGKEVKVQENACFTVGPFTEDSQAQAWRSELLHANIPSRMRMLTESEPKSYWIYLDPLPSLAAAKQRVAELSQQGVKEFYIVREEGPMQYAISLGLYNGIGKARQRLDELKAKNVLAEMDTRYRDVNYYWLDVQDDRKGSADRLVAELLGKDTQIRQLDAECSELVNLID